MPRCPACGARDFRASERSARHSGEWCECGHCGLLATTAVLASGELPALIDARLAGGRFVLEAGDPFFVESYSLRTLALSRGLVARPVGEVQCAALAAPYQERPAVADLLPLAACPSVPVSLVMLCRSSDLASFPKALAPASKAFDDLCLVVDAVEADVTAWPRAADWPHPVRLLRRPLAGDFGGQRNAGQAMARHDWVLQLDADETLDAASFAALGRVAALAEPCGSVSIGLPRRNRVDGILSDLFPDIQYRLNRRSVHFDGKVHERPALPRGWRDGFIAPNLCIDHHLSRAHVERRSTRYEAMDPGKGRLFEREALLTSYRD
ncbi:hypothetical protein VQ042_00695 [Aurantimonas sp. A2-1-M11]|uniref:hypothetical protein n=1 Tax=Aurantimonas sp. A2-1-M11 TaxID=3113712 RepID=UPI002F93604E